MKAYLNTQIVCPECQAVMLATGTKKQTNPQPHVVCLTKGCSLLGWRFEMPAIELVPIDIEPESPTGREWDGDLSPFTAPEKLHLNRPWSSGEHTYASNGAVLIVVPRRAGVEISQIAPTDQVEETLVTMYPERPDLWSWIRIPETLALLGDDAPPRMIGKQPFATNLLKLIQRLPDCEICHDYDSMKLAPPEGPDHPAAPFRFNGGFGLIMPVVIK